MPSAGTPASSSICANFRHDSGVSLAGLQTTEFPAASAGPTLWHTRFSGKLNGVIANTTPHGTRSVNPKRLPVPGAPSSGTTSEPSRLASSAGPMIVSTARDTSTRDSARILPSSSVIVRARSSARSSISRAAFISI